MRVVRVVSWLVCVVALWRMAFASDKAGGPSNPVPPAPVKRGDLERGRKVFRFETFGVPAQPGPTGHPDERLSLTPVA